jgi:uncharacterized membrane protein YfcA
VYGFREHLGPTKLLLRRFIPVSILGGLIGSILLTRTSNRTFSQLIPFLILFATVLFLLQGFIRRLAGKKDAAEGPDAPKRLTGAMAFQLGVAIYGGYFGAGIGILMLAALGFLGLKDIHEMNTVKTVLGSLINVVAAIWFIAAGLIHWPRAAVMTVGAVLGYYLGSHYSQRIPQARVRQIITGIGFIISAATFYEEFLK